MQVEFQESIDKDSYVLLFAKGNKYADIEFFDTGEILIGKTNRIDTPEIRDVTKDNIFEVIKDLVEFVNES